MESSSHLQHPPEIVYIHPNTQPKGVKKDEYPPRRGCCARSIEPCLVAIVLHRLGARVVTDRSGAAIAGAKIAITETERNVPHAVVTDEAGRYAVTALPPGSYTLTVEAPGFKKYSQTNIRSPCNSRPP